MDHGCHDSTPNLTSDQISALVFFANILLFFTVSIFRWVGDAVILSGCFEVGSWLDVVI